MSINVICPGCHARFQVNEKFAGRTGPCPKCQQSLTIPKADEQVKIHDRGHEGLKDSKGKLILKPVARTVTKFRPKAAIVVGGSVVLALVAAFALRAISTSIAVWLLGIGAVALAPPLVLAGYWFLRNDDMEPFVGRMLWIRLGICSVVYAGLWGVYTFIPVAMRIGVGETWTIAVILPPFIAVGSLAALACLDFDFATGFLHYSVYLLVCIILRFASGVPW